MAPSSYGAALWQKIFGGTLFGGLSLVAAFLLRAGGRQVQGDAGRNHLDPKVLTLVMGGLLVFCIYMFVDLLVHRYVITDDALLVYRPWGKQRILWKDIANVRWRDVKGTSIHIQCRF